MSLLKTKDAVTSINGLLPKSAESFFEIGKILKGVKEQISTFEDKKDQALAKLEYEKMVVTDLPFGKTVANKFVQIAESEGIGANLDIVPSAYNTMYALRDFTKSDFDKMRAEGLNSMSTAKDVSKIKIKLWGEKSKTKTADKDYEESKKIVQSLNSNKKRSSVESLNKLGSEMKFDTTKEVDAIQYITISVNAETLTAFEKRKLKDLLSLVSKLNFNSEKGVSVDNSINPNVLSDEPIAIAS